MDHRPLGRSGLKVSEICLGTMTFGYQCDEPTSFAILDRAAGMGVTFLDTADCYPVPLTLETAGRTEEILGRWLKGRRHHFVLASKCFFPMGPGPNERGSSRRHVLQAAEASLRRLQTDVIDLYQLHAFDTETPLEETLRALEDLVRAGKVRYLGCSNFRAWEVARALAVSDGRGLTRLHSVQPRYNVLYREMETEMLPLCRDQGLGVIVYNPLAGGLLTGKHAPGAPPAADSRFGDHMGATADTYRRRYWQEEALRAVAELGAFFTRRGKPLATVAVAWVLQQPGISAAIVGASRPQQLEATLAAGALALDEEERAALDEVWYRLPRQRPAAGPVR
ncbi:MAG TPA: aldo/keto reductase [Vicinamibacteria bacterium]|nr:aldo/keto reductase [Vicinamibacteria bacterium]